MKNLLFAILSLTLLAISCKEEEEREHPLITDRAMMPRQTIPAWPAGTVRDTCVEITDESGKLLTGSATVKQEVPGTFFRFSSGKGRHYVFDSMGFEMDRLDDGGRHYAYSYLYDTERKLLYKIGQRSRKGVTYRDTAITVYIGSMSFTASRADDGSLAITRHEYNSKGQLVSERNGFYYPNLAPAPAGNRLRYVNRFYYTGYKIDSLVTNYPANKPPFRKLKIVFNDAGLPQQALIEDDSVYSVFTIVRCADSESVQPH